MKFPHRLESGASGPSPLIHILGAGWVLEFRNGLAFLKVILWGLGPPMSNQSISVARSVCVCLFTIIF